MSLLARANSNNHDREYPDCADHSLSVKSFLAFYLHRPNPHTSLIRIPSTHLRVNSRGQKRVKSCECQGWFNSKIANGLIEGINSLVQAAKAKARGYRSIRNLKAIVYLLAGKLDLQLPS